MTVWQVKYETGETYAIFDTEEKAIHCIYTIPDWLLKKGYVFEIEDWDVQ